MKKRIAIITILLATLATPAVALEEFYFYGVHHNDQTFAIKQGHVNNYALVASTHKAVTVPTGASFALFSADVDIWVRVGGVAAVPAGDVTDGTGSMLNPAARYISGATTIGVISEYAGKLEISFY